MEIREENFNDFVLLELEKEIGGTARSGTGHPVVIRGEHIIAGTVSGKHASLFRCLPKWILIDGRGPNGEVLIKEQYLCREPEERIFYKGRWYEGLYLIRAKAKRTNGNMPNFRNRSIIG